MDGYHPKRRRDKSNPYRIYEKGGKYYLCFHDGQGARHEMEIEKALFDMLDWFELKDLAFLNEWDRHIEHSEQTEQLSNRRSFQESESVEDMVLRRLEYRQLHRAISVLPEIQRRRLTLYYFHGLTYKQIAEKEGCTLQAVAKSIAAAENKIKKFLSKG